MISKIKLTIVQHYQIILLALIIGFISSVPQYLARSNQEGFKGIYNGVVKDTIFYQARVKDVIDGHPFVTNPYLFEHKTGAPMQFWVPDYILAKPIGWLGLSVPVGYIIWTFVLTFLLAIFSYCILLILTQSKKWSIVAVLILHLGLFALKFIRLPPHGLNFIFWLVALLFLLLFITKGDKKYIWGSVLSFGMLFNIYPYYWTFFIVVFGVFLFLSFILRLQDVPYKKYFIIIFGGLIIGSPYFFALYKSSSLAGYSESLSRLGVISTHFPSGISSVFVGGIVLVIFAMAYWKKVLSLNHLTVFIFSGVLSSIIVINQHILTGKNAEFSSHYMIGNMFWFSFALLYVLSLWLKNRSEKIHRTFFMLSCVIALPIVSLGIFKLVDEQTIYNENESYIQNYRPVFDWLDKNAKPEEVVYGDDDISAFIPIYTKQNIFYTGYSILFFMTNQEVQNRFVINHYFDDFTTDYIRLMQRHIFGGFYVNEYGHNLSKNKLRKLFGKPQITYQMVPDYKVEKIQALADSVKKNSFEKEIKSYRVDYLVWDTIKDPNWKVKNQKFLKEVYSANGIIVYKVN